VEELLPAREDPPGAGSLGHLASSSLLPVENHPSVPLSQVLVHPASLQEVMHHLNQASGRDHLQDALDKETDVGNLEEVFLANPHRHLPLVSHQVGDLEAIMGHNLHLNLTSQADHMGALNPAVHLAALSHLVLAASLVLLTLEDLSVDLSLQGLVASQAPQATGVHTGVLSHQDLAASLAHPAREDHSVDLSLQGLAAFLAPLV